MLKPLVQGQGGGRMIRRLILRWQLNRALADRKRRRLAGYARPYLVRRGG